MKPAAKNKYHKLEPFIRDDMKVRAVKLSEHELELRIRAGKVAAKAATARGNKDQKLLAERLRFLRAASRRREIQLAKVLYEDVYLKKSPEADREEEPNFTEIDAWAKSFNLPGLIVRANGRRALNWVATWAVIEMYRWSRMPEDELAEKAAHDSFLAHDSFPGPNSPPPKWPRWQFDRQSEAEYRKHASVQLEAYIAAQKRERAHLPQTRTRNVAVEQRYEMAALRVCLAWPCSRIASHFLDDENDVLLVAPVVRKHVNNICSRIGLDLPPTNRLRRSKK